LRELRKSPSNPFNPDIDVIPNPVIDIHILSSRGVASENASSHIEGTGPIGGGVTES